MNERLAAPPLPVRTSGPVDLSPAAIERRRRVLAQLVATDRRSRGIRARMGGTAGLPAPGSKT